MAELFEIIKRQMAVNSLKPAQVAASMGISQRMVEFYIEGTKKPSFKNLVKLTNVLGFDMNELSEPKVPRETFEEDGEKYMVKRLNQKNNKEKTGIPIFESAPSTLTSTELYRDEKYGAPDFWVTIPFLRDCDYGHTAAMRWTNAGVSIEVVGELLGQTSLKTTAIYSKISGIRIKEELKKLK